MKENKKLDVIIIGGSYAGLSAAIALGRSLRNILIIDGGSPCNSQTPQSHNFLAQDGEKPAIIAEKAKIQVLSYNTVELLNDFAINAHKIKGGFEVNTQSGREFKSKKLIFATGVKDIMPNIKGFQECWGISVIHCPYCHGYEFRNQKTGIMASGANAFHIASLVNNLTNDITILTSTKADFNADQIAKLNKHHIKIKETRLSEIEHKNGQVKNLIFSDGSKETFNALYALLPFKQHSDIPAALGCELTKDGYIKVDAFQKTNINGVYACGDNTNMMRSVANAVYSGNITGAMLNKELIDDIF